VQFQFNSKTLPISHALIAMIPDRIDPKSSTLMIPIFYGGTRAENRYGPFFNSFWSSSALAWWFRSSLHFLCERFKRTSEPKPL
jgi:hypothetical protein